MQATSEQIDTLRKLQEADRSRLQAALALEKLPQPAQAAQVREKMEGIVAKIVQIQALYDEASSSIDKLQDEDDTLERRQKFLQNEISLAKDDYRKMTTLTRELETSAKRRETVSFEMDKATKRMEEVKKVLDKAVSARDTLAAQEADLAAAYRSEGGKLKKAVDAGMEQRTKLIASLPEDVRAEYERVLARCGGVALAMLEGTRCSVCRNVIDDSRIVQMRQEAPLSHCPNCGRLSIVE